MTADAFTLAGQIVDDVVDFIFGADIDAARRLVQEKHIRF